MSHPHAALPLRPFDLPKMIATGFGVGFLPLAPGTWASLIALPIGWAIASVAGGLGLMLAALAVFASGVWAAEVVIRRDGVDDPREVVIDEVAGQWLALLSVPNEPLYVIAAFVLFRVFDVLKPWPVSWADRNLTGGFGAMFDDMIAGTLALIAVTVLAELRVGLP